MATTTLHEYTHAPAVFSPGTEDNAYGYSASTSLSSSAAVLNADTYALYANGKFICVYKNTPANMAQLSTLVANVVAQTVVKTTSGADLYPAHPFALSA